MIADCKAASASKENTADFWTFKWITPVHGYSLGCIREKWGNGMFFSLCCVKKLHGESFGKDRERCLCRHYQELMDFTQLIYNCHSYVKTYPHVVHSFRYFQPVEKTWIVLLKYWLRQKKKTIIWIYKISWFVLHTAELPDGNIDLERSQCLWGKAA